MLATEERKQILKKNECVDSQLSQKEYITKNR